MWRDDAYLLDMLLAAQKVQAFTQGVTLDRFQKDDVLQNAVMHLIQIIGEAATKISPEFKQEHPEVPWKEIIGMRHHLVHEYFRINQERVWEVVKKDLPELISLIEPLVPPEEEAS